MKRLFKALAAMSVLVLAGGASFGGPPPPPDWQAPPPPAMIEASVEITPQTIVLRSNSKVVNALVELPGGFNVGDIMIGSVSLNGARALGGEVGDHDGDGVLDLKVNFDRQSVSGLVAGDVELTMSGGLSNGTQFIGSGFVRVK